MTHDATGSQRHDFSFLQHSLSSLSQTLFPVPSSPPSCSSPHYSHYVIAAVLGGWCLPRCRTIPNDRSTSDLLSILRWVRVMNRRKSSGRGPSGCLCLAFSWRDSYAWCQGQGDLGSSQSHVLFLVKVVIELKTTWDWFFYTFTRLCSLLNSQKSNILTDHLFGSEWIVSRCLLAHCNCRVWV